MAAGPRVDPARRIYPSVREPSADLIKDRGQVRSMWEWARDLDRQEPLWFEFARPIEIDPGSLEDIAIQLTEGWILGSSPTVRRSVTDRSAPLTWIGDS
jgi:hypothetical protein